MIRQRQLRARRVDLSAGDGPKYARRVARGARLFALLAFTSMTPGRAAEARDSDVEALSRLSLEELARVHVFTASRTEQPLNTSAAAAYVITRDEILRSGVTSIPEALRLAPGVQVARVSAQGWAITLRGFNGDLANKLLVLIDGRSVYSPLFAGVFWDVQDYVLEDIERIEVIGGPGGALWGANAVNGVINIITRSANDTRSALATASGGGGERSIATLRYGGAIGETTSARVYANYTDGKGMRHLDSAQVDDWKMLQAGFRADLDVPAGSFTWQGNGYRGDKDSLLDRDFVLGTLPNNPRVLETVVRGANMLGRWRHVARDGSEFALQLYVDHTERDIPFTFDEHRTTTDLDFQHRIPLTTRHELLWGAGVRLSEDQLRNSSFAAFAPDSRNDLTFSGFVQDKIALIADRTYVTLGTKLEHNDYTGFEIQPSLRLSWLPTAEQTVWAAVSRAVRVPSRLDSDLRLTLPVNVPSIPVPVYVQVDGSDRFDAERLLAYELGWRMQPRGNLHLDVATFYNDYRDLQTQEPLQPFVVPGPPTYLVLPNVLANGKDAHSYGGTIAGVWQPLAAWRLKVDYSYFAISVRAHSDSLDPSAKNVAGDSPRHQVGLQSFLDLPGKVSLFLGARYVDALAHQRVSEYTTLDASLQWEPSTSLTVALSGRNLFDPRHSEFGTPPVDAIERTVYGKVTLRF
jgi:iron complex outermembrane receptor protein